MSTNSAGQDARFFREVLASSDDCIKIVGLDGSLQFMSEGGQRVMEVDDFATLKGCPWPDFWQGQGNADAIAAIEGAREGRASSFLGYANTAKGNQRFWRVKVSPILDSSGQVESILSISTDITALKRVEEQQALLRGELHHRIKNILALVQAVANQTLRNDEDMAVAKPALLARLSALGNAHDLLMHNSDIMTTLRAVAETTVSGYADRILIDGPEVVLSSKSALAIALALHELTTNAVKYGALNSEQGSVSLTWQVTYREKEEMLELAWVERDGPAVTAPTHTGFGTRMIEKALMSYVNGAAEAHYEPSGLVFTLRAPLNQLMTD